MVILKRPRSSFHNRTNTITTLEQLSPEIFFDIFDYLTGNEICKSLYDLNSQLNQLVCNAPNVHLNLSPTKTKMIRTFQQIFHEQNIISVVLSYENITILETFFSLPSVRRFNSLSLLAVPLHAFENRIPELLNAFKHKLISLKIEFSDMKRTGTGAQAAQSFIYLLTALPLLKYLTLKYSEGVDWITYIPSVIVNNTIVHLTIWLYNIERIIPLLYRFQILKLFTFYGHSFPFYGHSIRRGKKAMLPDDLAYYRSQLREKTSLEYPVTLRHIEICKCGLTLENVEHFLKFLTPPTLFTLRLLNCERPAARYTISRRQPPFLDGTEWHDLLRKYLPTTMKRFFIEYEDVENTMSRTDVVRVKKEFIKLSGPTLSSQVSFSYNRDTKLMSFDLTFI